MNRKYRPGPDAIRTAKLVRYLMSGKSVLIEGRTYYLSSVVESGHGAVPWHSGTKVDGWTLTEIKMLAELMEGQVYSDVMNFKG